MNLKQLVKWPTIKRIAAEHTLRSLAACFALGIIVVAGGMAMDKASASPAFCGMCHAMQHESATHAVSSHQKIACVECHLPHDNIAVYYFEKGKTGMHDTLHQVLDDYPVHIKISDHGRDIVNDNCLRCHTATMGAVCVDKGKDGSATCTKCHSRIAHGSNPLEGGIRVE